MAGAADADLFVRLYIDVVRLLDTVTADDMRNNSKNLAEFATRGQETE